ncbi:MAG: oxygen-independent coproporphyrinogen III oxidase [Mastigocoleus sp.]
MVFQMPDVKFDIDIIKKYDIPTPRYTSYPPATELNESFTAEDFQRAIASSNHRKSPLSLYFHIPFCESLCYYCGCNVVIAPKHDIAKPYLEYLKREIKQTTSFIDSDREVVQLHWGGGTPNYLSQQQVEMLWGEIANNFKINPNAEISLEINPTHITKEYIFTLKKLGFNRISFGIQDFNLQVQTAVNRIQPEAMLFQVMDWIREAGFESVNVDLIYGLPYQTSESFRETIHKTLKLNPDRIAVFNFAYVPWLKPAQKKLPIQALPSPQEKLEIFHMTISELTKNQYIFIGMDHFAKPHDELAIAQRNLTLKRTFQGYTTHAETELLGFGATSVSLLDAAYAQNHKKLRDYYQAIDEGLIPVSRGFSLNQDDVIRRDVIMCIMSNFQLYKPDIEAKYNINFNEYFASELASLPPLEADGLIKISPNYISVTDVGRLLVRNIAVIFDSYIRKKEQQFSRAI